MLTFYSVDLCLVFLIVLEIYFIAWHLGVTVFCLCTNNRITQFNLHLGFISIERTCLLPSKMLTKKIHGVRVVS